MKILKIERKKKFYTKNLIIKCNKLRNKLTKNVFLLILKEYSDKLYEKMKKSALIIFKFYSKKITSQNLQIKTKKINKFSKIIEKVLNILKKLNGIQKIVEFSNFVS